VIIIVKVKKMSLAETVIQCGSSGNLFSHHIWSKNESNNFDILKDGVYQNWKSFVILNNIKSLHKGKLKR
jgi:hypothetical protein